MSSTSGRMPMLPWTSSLLEAVRERVRFDSYWNARLAQFPSLEQSVHLGVFVEPFLGFVLDGRKRVESRFSTTRRAPFRSVSSGDVLLLKRSSGPVLAIAEITASWDYELDDGAWQVIKTRFGPLLCVEDPEFWRSKASSCFATLMQLDQVRCFPPVTCPKRDRRGWVVIQPTAAQRPLLDLGL